MNSLGANGPWEFEIGQEPKNPNAPMQQSAGNPSLYRKDTRTHFVWRVRNVPWPKENYLISVDESDQKIVVKTVNKKCVFFDFTCLTICRYYTRITIPDMKRAHQSLQSNHLTFDWGANTLVIRVITLRKKETDTHLVSKTACNIGPRRCAPSRYSKTPASK